MPLNHSNKKNRLNCFYKRLTSKIKLSHVSFSVINEEPKWVETGLFLISEKLRQINIQKDIDI